MTRLLYSWQLWTLTALAILAATALLNGTPMPCETGCQTTGEMR